MGATLTRMTPRQRWLAAVRMEPVDRLPFWPKLDRAYPRAQPAPFRDMEIELIHRWIGSDRHVGVPGCTREVRTRTHRGVDEHDGRRVSRFVTPTGILERVDQFDLESQSWHPVEFPVRTRHDIPVMIEWFQDCRVELDADHLEQARARVREIGDDASTRTSIGISPLMDWVQHIAGIETAHLLLRDCPDEVAALFEAEHRVLRRTAEILADTWPGDMIYSTENTSTTLISPAQYEQYCYPHIRAYGEILSGAGRIYVLHMCGHLRALLPTLRSLPVDAFEAFTAPTLGNTTLLDGRAACPDTCLIGGTQAPLWTRPAKEIIGQLERDLDALPHHRGLVVTSAGVMPPLCRPETIKTVCDWVKSYPVRM
jgi:hypothetical protein